MLHQIFNVLSIGIRPALAGIRVMLRAKWGLIFIGVQACISRYSCNVTDIHFKIKIRATFACISRYSCNVLRNSGRSQKMQPALAGIRVMLHISFNSF